MICLKHFSTKGISGKRVFSMFSNPLPEYFGAPKKKILIIDDDEVAQALITGILEMTLRYEIITGDNGLEGIQEAIRENPDLIILDIMMPNMDGFEVCKVLRADFATRYIPIILLSAKEGIDMRIEGLVIGADDYITKPFHQQELVARVDALLRRNELSLDANPLTRLPGNISIERELMKRLADNQTFAVGYADLDNFKAFNDKYGFLKGDRVLFETGQIIRNAANRHDFVGHVGGDDFVFIASPENVDALCRHVIKTFDWEIRKYYDEESLAQGYIESENRNGEITRYPVTSISIAVVTNINRTFTHFAEISEIGAELKKYLKTLSGSNYLVDRRKNHENSETGERI
jgi:PleD family two-component response regulator